MKKTIFVSIGLICLLFGVAALSVMAEEVTGDLTPGLQTGIEGILKAAPTVSPAAGDYHATQTVTLTASGATKICYTTDGTTAPSCASATTCTAGTALASGGTISVSTATTVKSAGCYADASTGPVATSAYTFSCTTASVANGTVGAYSGCAITCNSGYTLSGSSCVASGGGGGGGGGSGGYTYTPPTPTPTPTPTPAPIVPTAPVVIPPPTPTPTPAPIVPTAPVVIPPLPASPTVDQMNAVLSAITAQVAYIAANPAAANAPALLLDAVQRLSELKSALGAPSPAPASFTRNLTVGSRGDDVSALQTFLKNQGPSIYPEGLVTGYFGALTRAALARYQRSVGISPAAGYFGPITRAKINQLLGL